MKKEIVIFGTGDIAQLACYYFNNDSPYRVVAFTVDGVYKNTDTFEGLPVVAFENITDQFPASSFAMFVALSYNTLNKVRKNKVEEARKKGYQLVSYVSSKCSYLSQFPPGENCFILEDNTVQPFVQIGHNVTLWSGNHIGHHSMIRDNNFISSHVVVSGHCIVNQFCFIGVNATLGHFVEIGEENIIGAGSIVTKNTGMGEVWVPARSAKLEKSSSEVKL